MGKLDFQASFSSVHVYVAGERVYASLRTIQYTYTLQHSKTQSFVDAGGLWEVDYCLKTSPAGQTKVTEGQEAGDFTFLNGNHSVAPCSHPRV